MKELVVVAIGGNSIIKDNASQSIEHQAEAVKAVADTVLEMLASDYDIGELCGRYAGRHRLSDPTGAE